METKPNVNNFDEYSLGVSESRTELKDSHENLNGSNLEPAAIQVDESSTKEKSERIANIDEPNIVSKIEEIGSNLQPPLPVKTIAEDIDSETWVYNISLINDIAFISSKSSLERS